MDNKLVSTLFIDNSNQTSKESTVFTLHINDDITKVKTRLQPIDFKHIEWIGYSDYYMLDIFKAYNDNPKTFGLYLGKKGCEFNV